MINKDFETVEQGIEKLKEAVELRNKMGGALYYNILNDDCCDIANKLFEMGADKEEIQKIMQG
jgi:hypothetical protein